MIEEKLKSHKNMITYQEFEELKPKRHWSMVHIGCTVWLDNGVGFTLDEKRFEKAKVTGYCGNEMFAVWEKGGRVTFNVGVDLYKVI